jgi:hypothetical protein
MSYQYEAKQKANQKSKGKNQESKMNCAPQRLGMHCKWSQPGAPGVDRALLIFDFCLLIFDF